MIELEPVIDSEARVPAPTPLNYISDLTRIESQLDWKPEISIEEGLRSLL
jgi:nucleoside-diphosphate-sugar epimerase